MDKFYIIMNSMKDEKSYITNRISEYLRGHNKQCLIQQETELPMSDSFRYTNASLIPDDTECIIVLGGDGTLLQAARDVVDKKIPLFGINLGTLGYLAEIDQQSIYPALDHLMKDEYEVEERMMLEGRVFHEGREIACDIALNDIVIRRDEPMRVVKFKNYVNEEFLNSYNADGIIISTPTGSTGYSLSAGGPIVSPTASMILMTPIAPHTLNTRSILFGHEDSITVEIGPGRMTNIENAIASFDGDTNIKMVTGDRIVISKAKKNTRIIKINHISFLEILRKKMSNS